MRATIILNGEWRSDKLGALQTIHFLLLTTFNVAFSIGANKYDEKIIA